MLLACEENADPIESRVTIFPVLEIKGDQMVFHPINTDFMDEGAIATIDNNPASFETIGSVDVTKGGIYPIQYKVVNSDGFEATVDRMVFVFEPGDSTIAGLYDGIREGRSGGPVVISKTEDPNVFEVSDINAGHYEFDRALGINFRSQALLTVDGNTITSSVGSNTFGNWQITSGEFNESKINWVVELIGQDFEFKAELTRKSF